MAANRGYDSLSSKSRLKLIEAASDLLENEGYQAVTARRVADRAGLKPQLVHYYFRSMEELVVAVFQRSSANHYTLHDEALSSPHPLRALWEMNCKLPEARRMLEYMALSKCYPMLRTEMRKAGQSFRRLQVEAIETFFAERGIEPPIEPTTLCALMSAITRNFVIEGEVENFMGHAGVRKIVEDFLDVFDPLEPAVAPGRTAGRRG